MALSPWIKQLQDLYVVWTCITCHSPWLSSIKCFYLIGTRTWTAILSTLTSSHMSYVKFHLHSMASLSTLTSVPLFPHQPLPNGSNSRLTLVSPATLYVSPTSTSSPWYEWICPLSVSLTTQSQSSQPRGKPHYSELAVGNHTRL